MTAKPMKPTKEEIELCEAEWKRAMLVAVDIDGEFQDVKPIIKLVNKAIVADVTVHTYLMRARTMRYEIAAWIQIENGSKVKVRSAYIHDIWATLETLLPMDARLGSLPIPSDAN